VCSFAQDIDKAKCGENTGRSVGKNKNAPKILRAESIMKN
jgi:hypothetical protein